MQTNLEAIDPLIRRYAGQYYSTAIIILKARYPELNQPYNKEQLKKFVERDSGALPVDKRKLLADINSLP